MSKPLVRVMRTTPHRDDTRGMILTFTVEVNMSKGWEVVWEGTNQHKATERFKQEILHSADASDHAFDNVRLTASWEEV